MVRNRLIEHRSKWLPRSATQRIGIHQSIQMLRGQVVGLPVFVAFMLMSIAGVCVAADRISLPTDPASVVVELWYVDQGQPDEPEIAVFANGRVRVNVGEGSIWGQLDERQVQHLVECLLTRDQLSMLTSEQLEKAIEQESLRTGLSANIRDAGETIIRIRTSNDVYRIDGHAVGLLANRFPQVPQLQQFYAAQRRLENVRAVIMVGGAPAARRLASLAQAKLQAESGEQIPVGPEDLSSVYSLNDGTLCCQFLVAPAGASPAESRVVSLFESPGEVPRISVLPDGPSFQ